MLFIFIYLLRNYGKGKEEGDLLLIHFSILCYYEHNFLTKNINQIKSKMKAKHQMKEKFIELDSLYSVPTCTLEITWVL